MRAPLPRSVPAPKGALPRGPPLLARVGIVGASAMIVLAIIGTFIAPQSPTQVLEGALLKPPSGAYWFGTDQNGMDIFSRTIAAPRYDVVIGLTGTLLAVVIGLSLGLTSGYLRGWATLLIRLSDALQSFPLFILAMAVVAFTGQSVINIIFVVGIVNAPLYARIAYAQATRLRNLEFVRSAVVSGVPPRRILLRHILPNSLSPIIAQASITVGWAILLTAGLSFVGAGVRPPAPEWGSMIAIGSENIVTGQWWAALFPGIALAITILSFSLVGDELNRRLGVTAV